MVSLAKTVNPPGLNGTLSVWGGNCVSHKKWQRDKLCNRKHFWGISSTIFKEGGCSAKHPSVQRKGLANGNKGFWGWCGQDGAQA